MIRPDIKMKIIVPLKNVLLRNQLYFSIHHALFKKERKESNKLEVTPKSNS